MFAKLAMRKNAISTTDDALQLFGGVDWPGFFDTEPLTKDVIAPQDMSGVGLPKTMYLSLQM